MSIENLTPLNGFDKCDLNNAKQNNYAWSISELKDYIYVGTGKNIALWPVLGLGSKFDNFKIPQELEAEPYNYSAEIWRFKKDGSRDWEMVYKGEEGIDGFRYMINYKPYKCKNALFAASSSNRKSHKVKILMTYNGNVWSDVTSSNIVGNTSRSMEVHRGKIYIATANELNEAPYLYVSDNPEINGWKTVLDKNICSLDKYNNPTGTIYNIKSFNGYLYLAVNSKSGIEVWRSMDCTPQADRWLKIGGHGFGDNANKWILSMNVFRNHLYFSATTELPIGYFIPRGAQLIRIDQNDNWELIVGDNSSEFKYSGINKRGKSGYGNGFSNPLNLYFWQIQEYKNTLYVTTLDHGSNLQPILEAIELNKKQIGKFIERKGFKEIQLSVAIKVIKKVLYLLNKEHYQFGFDLYSSENGVDFKPVLLDGLANYDNYGGRILFVDSCDDLYIGTANPFDGCEVWRASGKITESNNYKKAFNYKILDEIDQDELKLTINILSSLVN